MKSKLIISLCAVLIASTAMAQEESGKKGLFHSVDKLASATMVHGVDTNYVKTPRATLAGQHQEPCGTDRPADALHC